MIKTTKLNDADIFVKSIIYVNIAMFIIAILLNLRALNLSINPMAFLSPDSKSLFLLGASGSIPVGQFNRWWTLVSANYLHVNLLHIIFNMLAFKQISELVCIFYGSNRMFIIYTIGGIFGFLISFIAGVSITIGASAAICALMGAAFYYGKSRGGIYGGLVYKQIGGWMLGVLIIGFLVPGINNWGHIGGIIGGALVGMGLGYEEKKSETFFHKILSGFCVILTLIVLLWALGTAIYYH